MADQTSVVPNDLHDPAFLYGMADPTVPIEEAIARSNTLLSHRGEFIQATIDEQIDAIRKGAPLVLETYGEEKLRAFITESLVSSTNERTMPDFLWITLHPSLSLKQVMKLGDYAPGHGDFHGTKFREAMKMFGLTMLPTYLALRHNPSASFWIDLNEENSASERISILKSFLFETIAFSRLRRTPRPRWSESLTLANFPAIQSLFLAFWQESGSAPLLQIASRFTKARKRGENALRSSVNANNKIKPGQYILASSFRSVSHDLYTVTDFDNVWNDFFIDHLVYLEGTYLSKLAAFGRLCRQIDQAMGLQSPTDDLFAKFLEL